MSSTQEAKSVETSLPDRVHRIEDELEVIRKDLGPLPASVEILKQRYQTLNNNLANLEMTVDTWKRTTAETFAAVRAGQHSLERHLKAVLSEFQSSTRELANFEKVFRAMLKPEKKRRA